MYYDQVSPPPLPLTQLDKIWRIFIKKRLSFLICRCPLMEARKASRAAYIFKLVLGYL